jgi:16S rRNA (adenine1518-N6/adenine1519-N6)-dimethyltransferase
VRPRKRFGQHFLEAAWIARVIDAADPLPTDAFLEIGPGRGALTFALARRAGEVVAVEVDRDLAGALARKAPANVRVVTADVLRVDVATLLSGCSAAGRRRIIGNLPYNVSTPIISRLLEAAPPQGPVFDATLMVQKEVADRLAAAPGGGDYGVLSILTQARADVVRLIDLPPGAFRPAPQVHSTLVRLTFGHPRVPPSLAPTVSRLVRSVFTQRRKVLANALKAIATADGVSVQGVLEAAALDGRRRPETLQLAEFVRLAEIFASAKQPGVL